MRIKNLFIKRSIILLGLAVCFFACKKQGDHRKEISLNGSWKLAKTDSIHTRPEIFTSEVPVPGLVDMAYPSPDSDINYRDGIYWHKTSFAIEGEYPEIIKLKIGKARYHAFVYLNNKYVGENVYCFTSSEFNIREFLNAPGKTNDLLIGIGTANNLPDTVIWGYDVEKLTYIPGIYDDVKIVMSGFPFLRNVQIAPMPDLKNVRIVVDTETIGADDKVMLNYGIRELATGKMVAKGRTGNKDFTVHIPDCRTWSPESPFLYELLLSTGSDNKTIRFGMRTFAFDNRSGHALLNGKPYYLRGTNVTLYRFFEDPDRGSLPWENDWVLKLHQQFKSMYWNSMRYCIGFPPERWYEIADSVGLLVQDEYPVWANFDKIYPNVRSTHLAGEYRAWMKERWNHPSVVIWDAQNESVTDITGDAISIVREMDLSNRPWENGWSPPQAENDPVEQHPYRFSRYRRGVVPSEKGVLYDLFSTGHDPRTGGASQRYPPSDGREFYPNPAIINEYGWLWLNRDGSTTTLTDQVYDVAFGKNLTTEERIYLYNLHLGILTEYWRAHRGAAGVLHFCGLGYSRPHEPRGQTSDNFVDLKNLEFEPQFIKYVKPSFAPVGLMINFWEKKVNPGDNVNIEVYAINDLDQEWTGPLHLVLRKGDRPVYTEAQIITIPPLGRQIVVFDLKTPTEQGAYKLEAKIDLFGDPVVSTRDISVKR